MTDYKTWLGYLAIMIGLVSYVPYFTHIYRNQTKPHAFSWLIWAIITGIAFAAQIVARGGPGAWVTGVTAVSCFTVFIAGLLKGSSDITRSDWYCLVGAGLAIILWILTKNPVLAVILVIVIDAVGFIPTYRKGFYKPDDDTATTFAMSSIKHLLSIAALSSYSITTWLFPASLVITNSAFAILLLIRRKQLRPQP